MRKKKKVTNLQEYFNALADELDKLFPKGKCKERSQALVLNAMANIYAQDLLINIESPPKEKKK